MSSEEEEQGQMKSTDSASAKSDDLKSEVSDPNFALVSVGASCNFTVSIITYFFPLACLRYHMSPAPAPPPDKHLFHPARRKLIPGSEAAF